VRAGVSVYFAVALRRGRGFRFEVRLVRWRDDGPPDEAPRERTRRLLEAYVAQLEAWIREAPEQYFWLHRRWRTRPKGEAPGPHVPAYPERRPRRRKRPEAVARET
jgi:KDO2-lipid IV(A) lauroyltransferase